MKMLFRKTVLFALVAALGLASLPLAGVSAQGEKQPPNERLEQVWARQQLRYERMGLAFERHAAFIERVQKLIERAEANGKDASAVQSALDAFEAAAQKAQPIYESAGDLVRTHPGFDGNGKVTEAAKAQETVRALHAKFKEIKAALDGTLKALHAALKAFREANPRSPRPTPAS